MDAVHIRGGNALFGETKIQGSKNAVLPVMAAALLIEDISIIEMFMGLDMLDEKTRTVALIRKKYLDYTLNELCNAYQDETGLTISKSGLHHRFKKLSEQAAQLMQMQNE